MIYGNKITSGVSYKTISADFDAFMDQIKGNIPLNAPLYIADIDVDDLWDTYIVSFPLRDRQEYNCNCCKSFIKKFGALVYIDSDGSTRSALWDDTKDYGYFNNVVDYMAESIDNSDILNQAFSKEKFLGRPTEGGWTHLSIATPDGVKTNSLVKSAEELEAASKENFRMLNRALEKYSSKTAQKALQLLRSGQLYRSEKVIGQAEWFADLIETATRFKSKRKNVVWAAVGSAPTGFCNVNSSTLGSLMDDIQSCMSEHNIKYRFNDKMDPLKHRRPQTDPGAQNIKRGEDIIAKMGLKLSLKRRYATIDDLDLLWSPRRQKAVQKRSKGVFGSVVARNERTETVVRAGTSPAVMTFAKFEKKILPHAESVLVFAPDHGSYSALCTAVHSDAPNLLQWSNPVNWYVYNNGSRATQWNVRGNSWINVTGITLQPNMWNNECEHQGESVFFLLSGCKDSRNAGLALFPEVLKSELHEIRKTIESYSNSNTLQGKSGANACGIKFGDGSKGLRVRVVSKGVETEYLLDRMD